LNPVYLALIGSVLCLDVIAVAQIMISRPVVVGALLGFLLGDLKAGLFIGAIIELVWIAVIPVGLSVPPDVTVSAVLANCWYLAGDEKSALAKLAAIMVCIPAGIIFKKFDIMHRQFNVRLVRYVDKKLEAGDEGVITSVSLFGVFLFFLKAFIFFIVFIPAGIWALNVFCRFAAVIPGVAAIRASADFALMLTPAIGLGVLLGTFGKKYEKT